MIPIANQLESMQRLDELYKDKLHIKDPVKIMVFEGKQIEVPEWVNHIKKNDDGKVYGYQIEPVRRGKEWYGGETGIYPINVSKK